MDSQPTEGGFFVLMVHILGGLPHGLDDAIQAYFSLSGIAFLGYFGGGDGFHCSHGVSFYAGDLD